MEQNNNYYQIPNNHDQHLQEELVSVKQAIQCEIQDALFYNYLISKAPTRKDNLPTNHNMIDRYTTNYHTHSFTLDDWAEYIIPLVNRAQLEARDNTNPEYLYRKYILAGVLLGLGMNPEEAIGQINIWKEQKLINY